MLVDIIAAVLPDQHLQPHFPDVSLAVDPATAASQHAVDGSWVDTDHNYDVVDNNGDGHSFAWVNGQHHNETNEAAINDKDKDVVTWTRNDNDELNITVPPDYHGPPVMVWSDGSGHKEVYMKCMCSM
jgi:hypothetical protein